MGPLLTAAFSLGIKLQIRAMGVDRRWAMWKTLDESGSKSVAGDRDVMACT